MTKKLFAAVFSFQAISIICLVKSCKKIDNEVRKITKLKNKKD